MRRDLIVHYISEDIQSATQELLRELNPDISRGGRIVIKPNLVVAQPADGGATTHPQVVEGLIQYLQDMGCTNIVIAEGAWLGASTKSAFSRCGYDELRRRYGVELIDTKNDKVRSVSTEAGPIDICQSVLDAETLINVPVLKGHCQTRLTCALKNLKGCIPDREKRRFHTMGLTRPIAALGAAIRPALILVDSICGDLDFEEGGNPVYTGRLIAGFDAVQMDSFCCRLMGLPLEDVPYIALAQSYGAGTSLGADETVQTLGQPHNLAAPRPSGRVAKLMRHVEARSACSACYGNLAHALARMDEMGRTAPVRIVMGQDFKGQSIEGAVGIGRCCAGVTQSVPGCPPDAQAIVEALTRM